jgi:multidrug efflux system membrane fusion protein
MSKVHSLAGREFPMTRRLAGLLLLTCAPAAGLIAGCGRHEQPAAPDELPVVPVSRPLERKVTDYVYYTGRTDAVQTVGIRPRVTGYLVRMPFKEGSEVKTGDLLFEIDPRPYKEQLDQAQGQVNLYQAQWKLARTTYERDRSIATRVPGGVSQQQLDQDAAAVEEAAARVKAYEASLGVYKLNLDFTKVTSPIDGMVSRYYLTLGNLANQDQTLLTTVVSLDPMYAYFDVDENTLLRVTRAIDAGTIMVPTRVPIDIGLQGEEGYPHRGYFNFINNAVNPSTGTISVRGVFPNPRLRNGVRLLKPGMFVRVRLPIGEPHDALLVIDRALGSDQGTKFVYVLDKDNKVQYRRVGTGALQEDGLRVIDKGLNPGDRVVVGGVQQVRPLMKVEPDETPMPSLAGGQAPAAVPDRPQPPPPGANKQLAPAGKDKQPPPGGTGRR